MATIRKSTRKLETLERQLYGKSTPTLRKETSLSKDNKPTYSYSSTGIAKGSSKEKLNSDVTYLKKDLIKIFLFSSFAIGFQIILYFLIKNNLIDLKLF